MAGFIAEEFVESNFCSHADDEPGGDVEPGPTDKLPADANEVGDAKSID